MQVGAEFGGVQLTRLNYKHEAAIQTNLMKLGAIGVRFTKIKKVNKFRVPSKVFAVASRTNFYRYGFGRNR